MSSNKNFPRQRRFSFGRGPTADELDEEFAHHLESTTRELMACGLKEAEAREEARRRFGDLDAHRRACRRIDQRSERSRRRGEIFTDFFQDVRFAFRTLRKSPTFVLGTVLTLALGLGATTAIFSVVHGVLLKPLPYPEPDRLVQLWESNPIRGWVHANASPANFLDWRDRSESFEAITATEGFNGRVSLTGTGEPEMLRSIAVFGNFFEVMGVPPLLGRGFETEESWDGRDAVAMLSHGLWQRRFAGDPEIVGRSLVLDGTAVTVVGVMPEGFDHPRPGVEVWFPLGWQQSFRDQAWFRRAHFLRVTARLKPGVPVEQASAELRRVAAQLEEEYPETNTQMGAGVTGLQEWLVGDSRQPLALLLAAVSLVLLIACANVAHLQLARAAPRRQEMAVRRALGAGRGRLLRQLLTESFCLALAGGAIGGALGLWGTRALVALSPADLPRLGEVGPSWQVLAFAFAVTLLTGLLFGLAPALRSSRTSLGLAAGRRSSGGEPRHRRGRAGLVAAEVALAVMLVIGAGLLLRSFLELRSMDVGFEAEGVVVSRLELPSGRYESSPFVLAFWDQMLGEVRSLPGVTSAALADHLPLHGKHWTSDFRADGWAEDEVAVGFHRRIVGPRYFETLGVRLLSGRPFRPEDDGGAPPVVVVNEQLAQRYFPDEDPVGRRIRFKVDVTDPPPWRTIVGVVASEKLEGLDGGEADEVFLPLAQQPQRSLALAVRGAGDPLALLPSLRAVIQDLDPQLPLADITTLERVVSRASGRERFLMTLLSAFAGCALLLAVVGIYGTVAFGVAQRRREFGVRLALGAQVRDVLTLAVAQGMAPLGLGLALGLVGAFAGGRLFQSLLYGVESTDPMTFLSVSLLLTAAALLASYLPARRATQVDPATTLRQE